MRLDRAPAILVETGKRDVPVGVMLWDYLKMQARTMHYGIVFMPMYLCYNNSTDDMSFERASAVHGWTKAQANGFGMGYLNKSLADVAVTTISSMAPAANSKGKFDKVKKIAGLAQPKDLPYLSPEVRARVSREDLVPVSILNTVEVGSLYMLNHSATFDNTTHLDLVSVPVFIEAKLPEEKKPDMLVQIQPGWTFAWTYEFGTGWYLTSFLKDFSSLFSEAVDFNLNPKGHNWPKRELPKGSTIDHFKDFCDNAVKEAARLAEERKASLSAAAAASK
jgi:hypothetical protein